MQCGLALERRLTYIIDLADEATHDESHPQQVMQKAQAVTGGRNRSKGDVPEAIGARPVHGGRHDRLLRNALLCAQQRLPPHAAHELHGHAAGRRRGRGLPRRLQAERRLDAQLTGRRAVL